MLTQRLGSSTQKDPAFIDALIRIIKENPRCCDEVWLASDYGFPTLETHAESARILALTAKKFRAANVRVSLQISNTLGHGQYMSARDCSGLCTENSGAEHMIGPDGKAADYCFCPRGKNVAEYIKRELSLYCEAVKPYAVWLDDDIRATNHAPVAQGCFCDDCIASFDALWSCDFDRDTLVREINSGDMIWRERWVQFTRGAISDFVRMISREVHNSSPDSRMGLQYAAHGGYTGFGYEHIFSAMREETGFDPLSRPGGGAYSDRNPNEQIDKAAFIAWQNAMLPSYVTDIRPEIENLPDVRFGKTIAGTCFETSLYLTFGATAMSYAMLMNDYEPMTWHGEMLNAFSEYRDYWEALAQASRGSHMSGLDAVYGTEMWRKRGGTDFSWNYEPYAKPFSLSRAAIPVALTPRGAVCHPVRILSGEMAEYLTDGELEALLSENVICDGTALLEYQKRGIAVGVRAESCDVSQLYELYTEHGINTGFAGRRFAQSFYYTSGVRLLADGGRLEPFGVYATDSKNAAPVCQGEYPYGVANAVSETVSGGRWAVFGHYLFNPTLSSEKRRQIINTAEYIAPGRMAAILETPYPSLVLPREDAEGKTRSVSVVNTTVGESGSLLLRIRRPSGRTFIFMDGKRRAALRAVYDGGDALVTMPSVNPWSAATVFVEK